jgi:inosose dehydratase
MATQPTAISTNSYPYAQLATSAGASPEEFWPRATEMVHESGLQGWEPAVQTPAHLKEHHALASKAGLAMTSVYISKTPLHKAETSEECVARIEACALAGRDLGVKIMAVNPDPIQWGGSEAKNDAQLRHQATALAQAGRAAAKYGVRLAYHWHTPEFAHGAREAHHMLRATRAEELSICFDVHWAYRGCGNSNVAMLDLLDAYRDRIISLHIRQSQNHIWSETFGEGDVDYPEVARRLEGRKILLVLEQCGEAGTPKTLDPIEAARRSGDSARRLFSGVGSLS